MEIGVRGLSKNQKLHLLSKQSLDLNSPLGQRRIGLTFYFFMSHFSLAIVFPIFSMFVFREAGTHPLFFSKNITLGLLIAAFPLIQLLATFLRIDRILYHPRSLFLWAGIGFFASYLGLIWGTLSRNTIILLIFRALGGLAASNLLIVEYHLILEGKHPRKVKKWLLLLAGLGFMSGVLVGGLFLETFFILPYLIGLGLSLIFLGFCRPKIERNPSYQSPKFQQSWNRRHVSLWFFSLAWFATLQFFSLYVLKKFPSFHIYTSLFLFLMMLSWLMGNLSKPLFTELMKNNLCLIGSLGCSLLFSLGIFFANTFTISMTFHMLWCFNMGLSWRFLTSTADEKTRALIFAKSLANQKTLFFGATIAPLSVMFFTLDSVNYVYLFDLITIFISILFLFGNNSIEDY